MNPVKRFLLIFGAVYVVIAVALAVLLGPPGLSSDYRAKYGDDHERYLEIVKSDAYELYRERPYLHPPENEAQRADFAFAEAYASRPAFQREARRRAAYEHAFNFFNFVMIIVLAAHFGRKPLLDMLDKKIAEIRERIESAETARAKAEDRKAAAQARIDGLEDDKAAIEKGADARIAETVEDIDQETARWLEQINRETEERKQEEAHKAALELKRHLVAKAVEQVIDRYKKADTAVREAARIDQFIEELGRRKEAGRTGA